MKSELQVVKSLVKKYSNDKELGSAVRRFLTEDYWNDNRKVLEYRELGEFKNLTTYGQDHKEAEREWLEQLEKI